MKFQLTIDMGNSAFENAPAAELASILRTASARAERDLDAAPPYLADYSWPLFDSNGNKVGEAKIVADD